MKHLSKPLFFAMVLLLVTAAVKAQSTVAKIKYEQAEEAFLKNDYNTTLTKLDEAQKILGSTNPKILYLRLMADKGAIANGNYSYDFLTAARNDAKLYLKQNENVESLEEKFRQVYEFSEVLDALPKTRELFEQQKAEATQKRAAWAKVRALQVSDSLLTAYRVKKCATVKEFKEYNLRAFIGLDKQKNLPAGITEFYLNSWKQNGVSGPLQFQFNNKGLYLYSYTVLGETDATTAKNVYQSLIDLYPSGMDSTAVLQKEISLGGNGQEVGMFKVLPSLTGDRGNIRINYLNIVGGRAYVIISFDPQGD